MPPPFQRLTLAEFATLLDQFPFSRRINAVHMHHTWRPNHRQFQGLATIEGMWRFHTQTNGWSDIAQHITIDPEGFIWTGRSWNQAPASAGGHNGNRFAGPFMFEMIGDFDVGQDRFDGAQRATTLRVITLVQQRFTLPPSSLAFHNQMSSKTCPGSAIDYEETLTALQNLHQLDRADLLGEEEAPRTLAAPFGPDALAVHDLIAPLSRSTATPDPADAEPAEEDADPLALADALAGREAARGDQTLRPELLDELRPYVVNLNQGRFSTDGAFTTTEADVDALFDEHLPRALDALRAEGEPLRLLFYAHGGLVSEETALRKAYDHARWWRRNLVYPVFFVWETGLFETLGGLLRRWRRGERAARDLFDHTTDPAIEWVARRFGGPKIWGAMKWSAAQASAEHGGAAYVARRLAAFCEQHGGDPAIELHAVGHSAGSIFHAHFLQAAHAAGAPAFDSLQLLAPAIRTDQFAADVAPLARDGDLGPVTMYTMRRDLERADDCARIYRKSLLYLVHHALEREEDAPLLGLEESVRADDDLKAFFGLRRGSDAPGEVVWSTSATTSGRSASQSRTHGGFDDDAPTMNSVARRILGPAPLRHTFPEARTRTGDAWYEPVKLPDAVQAFLAPTVMAHAPQPPATLTVEPPRPPAMLEAGSGSAGRRRALCVGIDGYPTAPLAGCVNDARAWARALEGLGFGAPRLLLNEAATRAGLLDALGALITESRAGDVLVFQFAGHGTRLPDLDGDETEDQRDDAFCPFDFDTGAFLIDDDVYDLFQQLPEGVNLTCFIDCCHSGSITRVLGDPSGARPPGRDVRARFLAATPAMEAAHERFRSAHTAGGRASRSARQEAMRNVMFAACREDQVAWETDGQGAFTVRATRLLEPGALRLTHEAFHRRVVEAFGPAPRQTPVYDGPPGSGGRLLLQPLTTTA